MVDFTVKCNPWGSKKLGSVWSQLTVLFQFCSCACFPQLLLVIRFQVPQFQQLQFLRGASFKLSSDLTAVFFVGYDSHACLCRLLVDFAMAEQLVEWFGTLKFNSVSLGSKSLFAYLLGLFSVALLGLTCTVT